LNIAKITIIMSSIPLRNFRYNSDNTIPFEIARIEKKPAAARAGYPKRNNFYQVYWLDAGTGTYYIDFVVEATGNDAGFAQSLRLVRPLGTLVLKSTFAGHSALDLTKLVVSEINVVGSRCGPFAPALRLMALNQIDPRPLIDGEYALADGLAAFQHAAQPGIRKILIRP